MRGIARRTALALAGAGAIGTIAFAGNAAAAAPDQSSATESVVTTDASWHYITDYFWASDCNDAGNRGMDDGNWSAYECRNGGPFSNYDLYVWY
ncbi:MAG TPA: hypothetical protein VHC49_10680 [Mycobacteriales bacterium]|nr:hypothetical protein [Mycobacteriales bacterium]